MNAQQAKIVQTDDFLVKGIDIKVNTGKTISEKFRYYIAEKANADTNLNRIQSLLQTIFDYEFGHGVYSAQDVLNYGCWCQLGDLAIDQRRHGIPVNSIDKMCHDHFRYTLCLIVNQSLLYGLK